MRPFLGSAAIRSGEFTRRGLVRQHSAIYRDVYLPRDVELTARLRAHAAWLATGATLAGISAAAVHGTKWLDASTPAEVIRADQHHVTGIVSHAWDVHGDDVCAVGGIDATTPARTAFDIGRLRAAPIAIPILDALFNATGLHHADVSAVADSYPGVRGAARLRTLLPDVDGGAESPQESRLRLLLVGGGLPRPETQIRFPHLRIRVDMMRRPDLIIARVRDMLRARGCPV